MHAIDRFKPPISTRHIYLLWICIQSVRLRCGSVFFPRFAPGLFFLMQLWCIFEHIRIVKLECRNVISTYFIWQSRWFHEAIHMLTWTNLVSADQFHWHREPNEPEISEMRAREEALLTNEETIQCESAAFVHSLHTQGEEVKRLFQLQLFASIRSTKLFLPLGRWFLICQHKSSHLIHCLLNLCYCFKLSFLCMLNIPLSVGAAPAGKVIQYERWFFFWTSGWHKALQNSSSFLFLSDLS